MVFLLTEELAFPDPHNGDPDGLLAVGGDLSVDRLLLAYSNGIFPWYAFRQGVKYDITFNQAFDRVIKACGDLRKDEEGAWLGEDMIKAYTALHEQGFAASVEVWEEDRLVGGLYGVAIGRCFFGESMFSRVPSASKLALIHLARFFEEHGGALIDCQFETPHLKSMGGRYISYETYMKYVQE